MAAGLIGRGAASRRSTVAALALVVMSACGGATTESTDATAHSQSDGVETWDLTGKPSDAAFGIDRPSSAAIYETQKPRPVRILLPGRAVEMDAVLVDFHGSASGGGYTFGVRTAELKPAPLTEAFRGVLRQLDVDDALAEQFAQQVAVAPSDQPAPIEVGVGVDGAVVLGEWTVGPSVNIAPLAGAGRVIFSGSWPPL